MSDYDAWKTRNPESEETCPKCGGNVIYGYGLMGGGIGAYSLCDNEKCDYFDKTQDGDDGRGNHERE